MIFSIIITSYNTKKLTKECIDSVFLHCDENDFEIIVVDNNSHDGSAEMLQNDFGKKIKLIINKNNAGFGAANNLGAKSAKGDYLFFLNSDTIIESDILKPMFNNFKKNSKIGIISPKLLNGERINQFDAYGEFPTLIKTISEKIIKQKANTGEPSSADWVSGAALVIRKNLFDTLEGFDEKFFMYFEDIDLCKRVKESGYGVNVFPKVEVIHFGGQSFKSHKRKKDYYYKSQDFYFEKHHGKFIALVMKMIRFPYKLLSQII